MSVVRLLIGDIGGTNARLVLYEAEEGTDFNDVTSLRRQRIVVQRNYKNNDFKSFSDVLLDFMVLDHVDEHPISACCFAVAGPVVNNRINFTNRDGWIIDRATIEQNFQIKRVELLNDFVAAGHGLEALGDDELITLQAGKPRMNAPIALVGAGTGLGECYLAKAPSAMHATAFPSEGGHVEFAPRSTIEDNLLKFLQRRFTNNPSSEEPEANGTLSVQDAILREHTRVSVERVLSGRGLENIYEFLRFEYPDQVDPNFDDEYESNTERGRLIGKNQYNYVLFRKSLEIMFGIYGSEVGNVALKYLPYGGLYIAGGIAPKNVELMTEANSLFMQRFRQKGRLSSVMPDFPVHVVMKEDLGLRGAHITASRLMVKVLATESNEIGAQEGTELIVRGGTVPSAYCPTKPDTLRHAVSDYPLTYAWLTAVTAMATASVMATGAVLFARKRD